jgi:hypothetical protein
MMRRSTGHPPGIFPMHVLGCGPMGLLNVLTARDNEMWGCDAGAGIAAATMLTLQRH